MTVFTPKLRWLQFGVLDLLMFTAMAGIGVALFQPAKAEATRSKEQSWPAGIWWYKPGVYWAELWLFPDGLCDQPVYGPNMVKQHNWGRWTISPASDSKDGFVLQYGDQELVFREWGGRLIEQAILSCSSTTSSVLRVERDAGNPRERGQ